MIPFVSCPKFFELENRNHRFQVTSVNLAPELKCCEHNALCIRSRNKGFKPLSVNCPLLRKIDRAERSLVLKRNFELKFALEVKQIPWGSYFLCDRR